MAAPEPVALALPVSSFPNVRNLRQCAEAQPEALERCARLRNLVKLLDCHEALIKKHNLMPMKQAANRIHLDGLEVSNMALSEAHQMLYVMHHVDPLLDGPYFRGTRTTENAVTKELCAISTATGEMVFRVPFSSERLDYAHFRLHLIALPDGGPENELLVYIDSTPILYFHDARTGLETRRFEFDLPQPAGIKDLSVDAAMRDRLAVLLFDAGNGAISVMQLSDLTELYRITNVFSQTNYPPPVGHSPTAVLLHPHTDERVIVGDHYGELQLYRNHEKDPSMTLRFHLADDGKIDPVRFGTQCLVKPYYDAASDTLVVAQNIFGPYAYDRPMLRLFHGADWQPVVTDPDVEKGMGCFHKICDMSIVMYKFSRAKDLVYGHKNRCGHDETPVAKALLGLVDELMEVLKSDSFSPEDEERLCARQNCPRSRDGVLSGFWSAFYKLYEQPMMIRCYISQRNAISPRPDHCLHFSECVRLLTEIRERCAAYIEDPTRFDAVGLVRVFGDGVPLYTVLSAPAE